MRGTIGALRGSLLPRPRVNWETLCNKLPAKRSGARREARDHFWLCLARKINAENTTEAGPTARSSSFFKHVLRAECTYHSKEL